MITWICKPFAELTNEELYKILQLRSEVFVVEQNCAYQDCDDKDQHGVHLIAREENRLVAYSRLLPPNLAFKEPSIGRVLTAFAVRGRSIGKELMLKSIGNVYRLYGNLSITIGAQLYLKRWYESLGFLKTSEPYLEDGIMHIEMVKLFQPNTIN